MKSWVITLESWLVVSRIMRSRKVLRFMQVSSQKMSVFLDKFSLIKLIKLFTNQSDPKSRVKNVVRETPYPIALEIVGGKDTSMCNTIFEKGIQYGSKEAEGTRPAFPKEPDQPNISIRVYSFFCITN